MIHVQVECLHRRKLFNKYQPPSLLPWEESIVFSLLYDLLPSHCWPSGYPCTKWDFHFLHSPYNHLHPLLVLKTSLTGSVIFLSSSVFIWDFKLPGELKLLLSLSLSELGRSGNQGSHGDLAKPPADDQLNWCFSLPHTDSAHHQL